MNKDIKFEKIIREDRRKQPRYKLSEKYIGKVKVKVKPLKKWYCRSYKTILIDFSRNGLKLRAHHVLNINDKVKITFSNGATVLGSVRNIKKLKVDGWLARIFQHEIDHLNGVVFTDLATQIWQPEEPIEDTV